MTKVTNAPMSSAPFVYGEKGEILWDQMWEKFCALATEGGPSHREEILESKKQNDFSSENYKQSVSEILRAYKMLIKYKAWSENGWICVKLYSTNMAKWFANIINSENVECRQKGRVIYLPVNDDFKIEKEVKNVVTVLAKADHYWRIHRNWFTKLIIHITEKDIHTAEY
jgi:sirohydrochlorin cobaltochelatase